MANAKYDGKYLRCDISFVRDAVVGGRLYSAQINEELPNGVFGTMGATLADKPEVKAFALPTTNTIKDAKDLYIVMKPEIVTDETFKDSGKIGNFRNEANKPFPIIRVQERDRVTLSQDYFTKSGEIAVGDAFVVDTKGLLVHKAAPANTTEKYKFVVTEIVKSHIANFLAYDEAGSHLAPAAYNLITVEMMAV